ncbi:hypothetical protein BS47DRAFT_1366376 [Hydnum rufescens UP504]|uniref:Uncharacterized protein n=1 Tax=Hydnum rufescens UP504 TaxID=1448309 RepID=A0A9P6DQW9_9AGAM|nr:hypothetical protein BS47DRAFT_1366376 [Hydnum rufescens UP504]
MKPRNKDAQQGPGTPDEPHACFGRIQIKPPKMTTHPNGHPSVCKTKYKAHDQGAKLVPHTCRSRLLSSVKTCLMSTWASPSMCSHPSPKGPPPEMTIDKPVYHTPTLAGVPSPHENPPDEHTVCGNTLPSPSVKTPAQKRDVHSHPQPATQSKNPQSWCKKQVPHTHFSGCVVILSLSSGPNTHDPAE